MKLTIFTPTYNRGYIINRLYESLIKQTSKDFEWLVIDDGSVDNTSELIAGYIAEDVIEINYIKKENGGKHTAANVALDEAKGVLFFVVDSDDFLTDDAVERILHYYELIEGNDQFCGICGLKSFINGKVIGGDVDYDVLDCSIIDYRFKHQYVGDRADVFRTELLKNYRYPEFPGEKWCPLSLVWNKIGTDRLVKYFNEVIYVAEYLPDGISLNRLKTRKNAPNISMIYYAALVKNINIPFKSRMKAAINYWRFSFYAKQPLSKKIGQIGLLNFLLYYGVGWALYLMDNSAFFHKHFLEPNRKLLQNQASN